MRYINSCLQRLAETDMHSLEPTSGAATEWHQRAQAEINTMVWSHPAVKHSYFKNADGQITPSARGGSASTGPRCANPIGPNLFCHKESE